MLVSDFTIDDSMDVETVRKIVFGIRRLVKMGKFAEMVLRTVEEKGYYDGKIPSLDRNYSGFELKHHSMRQKNKVVRDEWMPLSDLSIQMEMEDGLDDHGGSHFRVASVSITGMMFETKSDNRWKIKEFTRDFGRVRFLKSGLSFVPEAYGSTVIQVYRQYHNPAVQVALKDLSKIISQTVVHSISGRTYLAHDLEINVEKWIYEEGHALRIMKQMAEQAKVLEVLNG